MNNFIIGDTVLIQPDKSRPGISCDIAAIKIENNRQLLHLIPRDDTRQPELLEEYYPAGACKSDPVLFQLG